MQLVPEKLREPFLHLKIRLFEPESLHIFFTTFKLKIYLLLLISPIGLGASAYITTFSIKAGSVVLFLLSLLTLIPWTLIPISFLFLTYQTKTWQRKLSWTYVGLLIFSYIGWLIFF
ncbi:hypothetical protein [Bacillus nitroreducens]